MQPLTRLLATALLFCSAVSLFSQSPDERRVLQIVERYVQSTGGYAALEKVESVRIEAIVETNAGDIINLTVLKKKPNLVRVSSGRGMKRFVRGYDGVKAWELPPYASKAAEMKPETARNFVRDAALESPLVHAAQRGIHLELLGTEDIEGHECYDILVVYPDGGKTHYFIDTDEYVERKFQYTQTDGETDKVVEIYPSEYEKIEGLLFAFRTDSFIDGKKDSTILVQDVAVNPGILDAAFRMP